MAPGRKSALVSLFTRFPNPPGSCKTRLIPTLGPRGASRCQTVMTEHILDTLLGIGEIAVEVRYATSSTENGDVSADMDFWLSPRYVMQSICPVSPLTMSFLLAIAIIFLWHFVYLQ